MQHKKPDPFYLTKAWRELREVALARDNYLCQRCFKKKNKLISADMVHHIKPRLRFPDLALVLENLISLCWGCHNIVEPRGKVDPGQVVRRARIIKG